MLNTIRCFFNSKCRDALHKTQKIKNWNAKKDEAQTACLMLNDYLINHYHDYNKFFFTTSPVPPYFFMKAQIEREIQPYFVIKIDEGVLLDHSMNTIQNFMKFIDVLHTEAPKDLALMVCSFLADETDFLVTDQCNTTDQHPKINPPDFHINEDGSADMTFTLKKDGRSTIVTTYTLHIAPDYTVTLNHQEL